jgi:hypothetical protein
VEEQTIFYRIQTHISDRTSRAGVTSSAPATTAPLFVGTSITPTDVGRTLTATQATDPNFNDFAALLTDGGSKLLWHWVLAHLEIRNFL